jgi:hypothetical protein
VNVRYAVTLDGQTVGTISLAEDLPRIVIARVNPLPAFRAIRAARRELRAIDRDGAVRIQFWRPEDAPTDA